MDVKNYMEQLVQKKLGELLDDKEDICKCSQCQLDMITYALNHLPPKYISSHQGEVFTKIDGMSTQQEADIYRCLTDAINVVSSNPRHDKQE